MEKGFKELRGMRIMLSLPTREKSVIKLDPETQKELDKEYSLKFDKLEVYAIGEHVDGISIGDVVHVPTDELRRGTFVEINGEQKLIIPFLAISLIW